MAQASTSFDPESVDLDALARALHESCGPSVEGLVVGRTVLRDAVVQRLGCSQLDGERLLDTMISRGFVVEHRRADGLVEWVVQPRH